MTLRFEYNDGGRSSAPGFEKRKKHAGDCVTRAIAITTGKPYAEVWEELYKRGKAVGNLTQHPKWTPDSGASRAIYEPWLKEMGWTEEKLSGNGGKFCSAYVPEKGTVIAMTPRHLAAVVNGVVLDTFASRTTPTGKQWKRLYAVWTAPAHVAPAPTVEPTPAPIASLLTDEQIEAFVQRKLTSDAEAVAWWTEVMKERVWGTVGTLAEFLVKHKLTSGLPDECRGAVCTLMHEQGLSQGQIAAMFGLSQPTVSRAMNAFAPIDPQPAPAPDDEPKPPKEPGFLTLRTYVEYAQWLSAHPDAERAGFLEKLAHAADLVEDLRALVG